MFASVGSRYVLRAVVAALIAGVTAASAALTDGAFSLIDTVAVLSSVLGAFSVYLGLGAAIPSVEPFVGNKYEGAQVPIPPAVDEEFPA